MKTKNLLLALLSTAIMLPAFAQQPAPQKKLIVNIVKDVNGKKQTIEKEFSSEEEMHKYLKENKVEPLCAGPNPASAPGCYKQVTIEKKEVKIKTEAITKPTSPAKPELPTKPEIPNEPEAPAVAELPDLADLAIITEDVQVEVNDLDSVVEEITIIRRIRAKEEVTAAEPPAPEKPQTIMEGPSRISDLSFFPNPNGGNFHVRFKVSEPSDVKLEIVDLSGKNLYATELKGFSGEFEKNIYKSELPAGTYLMEVTVGGEKKALKIMVQK